MTEQKEMIYKCDKCECDCGQVFAVKENGKIYWMCSKYFHKKDEK